MDSSPRHFSVFADSQLVVGQGTSPDCLSLHSMCSLRLKISSSAVIQVLVPSLLPLPVAVRKDSC
jgi:hypothetical protein